MSESEPTAYYVPLGQGRYLPTLATESPWDHEAQHGGPPTALLAHEMQTLDPNTAFRIARITTEFLGVIPRRELRVEAQVVRPGRRIRMLEATMSAGGRPVATARAWQIAVQPDLEGLPYREQIAVLPHEQQQHYFTGLQGWGYGESIEWRWERGSFEVSGPASVWARVRLPLIEGEPIQALDRALILADSANGISAILPLDRWLFVPPAITVTLHRYPDGEWVRLDAETTLAPDGLGSTLGSLSDLKGLLGTVTQPLLITPR